jgi:hypothetical protein
VTLNFNNQRTKLGFAFKYILKLLNNNKKTPLHISKMNITIEENSRTLKSNILKFRKASGTSNSCPNFVCYCFFDKFGKERHILK